MAEYNKVYASLKPELPKVIQQEQIYVYAPRSSRAGMKNISSFNITSPVAAVLYDTTDGITVIGDSSLVSEEVSGEKLTQNFQSEFSIPVRPGKYINIDADADNNYVVIKVDDTALTQDYYKIDKSDYPAAIVPIYYKGKQDVKLLGFRSGVGTIVMRGGNAEIKCNEIEANSWRELDGTKLLRFTDVKSQLTDGCFAVSKTSTDTGSLSVDQLTMLRKLPQYQIQYNNQTYYRMNPLTAPDGTLNYIHIDSVQNVSSVYKATGKCFSITVSTRAWKVFDLEFGSGGSGNYIPINNTSVDTVPVCKNGAVTWTQVTNYSTKNTIVKRDDNNGISCLSLTADLWRNTAEEWDRYVNFNDVYAVCKMQSVVLADTDTVSSGTLSNKDLTRIKTYITNVVTRGTKVYVRMKNYNSTTEMTMQFVCVNIDVTVSIEVVNIDSTTGAWTVETYYPASADEVPGTAFGAISELSMLEGGAAITGSNTNGYSATGHVDITTKDGNVYESNGKMPIPIIGDGKYLTTSVVTPIEDLPNDQKLKISVDDTALALDYFKIDKTAQATISSPVYVPGSGTSVVYMTPDVLPNSAAKRDSNGDCSFRYVTMNGFGTSGSSQIIGYWTIWRNIYDEALSIDKTSADTGTLTATDIEQLQAPGYHMVKYDNQLYYRYDPRSAPDGTLNYIHLDSLQDGEGGYKATGKCFSITVSTRAWQVVDLDFGGQTTHNIYMDDPASGVSMIFTVQSNKSTNYSPNTISELAAVVERIGFIPCVVEPGTGAVKAGYITADKTKFTVKTDAEYNYTFNQVTVQDTIS
nr:MAG TPA: hypothetical protein [Caudoviricetes sp.]